jgi:DEAD/DEAH box helicase domain-containing protein
MKVTEARSIADVVLGAIYMHQGNTYLVRELDVDQGIASVVSVNVEWTTRQRDFTYTTWWFIKP